MYTGNRRGTLFRRENNLKEKSNLKIFHKKTALQAHGKYGHIFFQISCKIIECLERVFLRLSVTTKAAVSIEASVSIPIFIIAFLEILSLLNYLSAYSGVLYALKSAGEPASVYSYAMDLLMDSEQELSLGEEMVSSVIFSEVYLDSQIRKACQETFWQNTIQGGSGGIQLLGSYVDMDNSCLSIRAWYFVEPIVNLTGREMLFTNRFYTRLWTGYSMDKEVYGKDYVYVTESGSVYHLSSECTYLRLSIRKVTQEGLLTARNESGSKYTACEACCKNNVYKACYYITNSGERYHSEVSCPGLKRTVYSLERDEVAGWPICSRCSREEER